MFQTFKVIEEPKKPEITTNVKLNTPYYAHLDALVTKLVFTSSSEFTINNVSQYDTNPDIHKGTYTVTEKNIILKYSDGLEKYIVIDNSNMEWYLDPDYYNEDV